MVTSGGANYPNGTYYTPVKGDGGTTAIIKLVVSGGVIQEFGDGSGFTSMQNIGLVIPLQRLTLLVQTSLQTQQYQLQSLVQH